MNTQLQAILETKPATFVANIRDLTRKEIAANVRKLLKTLNLKGVSVTTPNYSMAQSILIRLPGLDVDDTAHGKLHDELYYSGKASIDCPDCAQRQEACKHLETIILAAFPDLGDRSDLQSDYFNYCLSFE